MDYPTHENMTRVIVKYKYDFMFLLDRIGNDVLIIDLYTVSKQVKASNR